MRLLILLAVVLAGCVDARSTSDVSSGREVIEAMKLRYHGKWYKTLTFVQETVQYRGAETDSAIWYEALELPGKLRIDIAPIDSGNGLLFVNDHRYVFERGSLVFDREEVHTLLLLGFDVYALPAEQTIATLDTLGFDLDLLHESTWNDREVYVVGAPAGDSTGHQFWVDKEHLYFVRLVQPGGPGGLNTIDVRFDDYETAGGGWVAPTVEFYVDGNLVLLERYKEIQIDREIHPDVFNPDEWSTENHWATRP